MPYIPKPIDRYQVSMDSLDTMVAWDSIVSALQQGRFRQNGSAKASETEV